MVHHPCLCLGGFERQLEDLHRGLAVEGKVLVVGYLAFFADERLSKGFLNFGCWPEDAEDASMDSIENEMGTRTSKERKTRKQAVEFGHEFQ